MHGPPDQLAGAAPIIDLMAVGCALEDPSWG
jgi:hypothetical protein